MRYSKLDAKMTKGLAIVCMVLLHLFCRQGSDVFGKPILWINETTPAVFLLGYFAEICVPLYSVCTGYAQEMLYIKKKSDFSSRINRILRLMINYWIVLFVFSGLALVFDPGGAMPNSWLDFIKSIFLLHSYNGAWWFLNTYVFLILISPKLILYPVHGLSLGSGALLCAVVHFSWYMVRRFGIWAVEFEGNQLISFLIREIENLISVLPCVWIGAFFARFCVMDKVSIWLDKKTDRTKKNNFCLIILFVLFISTNLIHKSIIMAPTAVIVFCAFNLWEKKPSTERIFLFLGEHSTNIWLVHMFFYAYVFKGLVQKAIYPVLMFAFLMVLSIGSSFAINIIKKIVFRKIGL